MSTKKEYTISINQNNSDKAMNIKTAHRLKGVGEYYFSTKLREIDEMRAAGKEIISLGIGSPDRPPHPSVIESLNAEAQRLDTHAYQPYKGSAVLRNAFAAWYGERYGVTLDPATEILPLIGSKEGLMHILMTYIDKGDRVLIPNPGYPTYRSAATIARAECVTYNLRAENGWFPDFNALEKEAAKGVKLMVVNYPHMPTGATPTRELFDKLIAFASHNKILLIHDNPYSFVRNNEPMSLLASDGAMEVAIELNSLSKSHNMAGWRIGMIGAKAERINEIIRFKSNMDSGMFYPIQAASAQALSLGDEWYRELNDTYYSREAKGYEVLEAIGCKARKDQAGLFLWAELPEDFAGDCFEFSDMVLYEKGVFITPGGIFGSEGNRYIRISLCATEQTLQRAIDKLKA